MIFENLKRGQSLTMRDGQFNYEVCYVSIEARQVCIEDWATNKLFVLEADGPMLPHLKVLGPQKHPATCRCEDCRFWGA